MKVATPLFEVLMLRCLSLVLLAGCAAEIGSSPEVVLELEGKEDLAESVPVLGAIRFGSAIDGEIATELELDAYTFDARASAAVSLAVTPAGESGLAASQLLVFGPRRETGLSGPLLARVESTSSGLASLERVMLGDAGTYTIVVGSPALGGYTLSLACLSGTCTEGSGALGELEVAPLVERIFAGEPPQNGQFQRVSAYAYDGELDVDAALAQVREADERKSGSFRAFSAEGLLSPAALRSALAVFDLSLDGIIVGTELPRRNFRAIGASYGRQASSGTTRGNLYVLDFPSAHTFYVVDVGYY